MSRMWQASERLRLPRLDTSGSADSRVAISWSALRHCSIVAIEPPPVSAAPDHPTRSDNHIRRRARYPTGPVPRAGSVTMANDPERKGDDHDDRGRAPVTPRGDGAPRG